MQTNCVIFFICLSFINLIKCSEDDLLVLTVATEPTDGYNRYLRSLKAYNYKYEVYGMGEEWRGGEIKTNTGGGQKINTLLKEIEKYKNDQDKIILFSDSYDVIISQEPTELINKFKSLNARVVFGAESFCWPDPTLEDDYPPVAANHKRYLNSGGFMGYAPELYEIVSFSPVKDDDDDQLYYTKIYLNKELREKLNIKLDTASEIFENLNGAIHEISLISTGHDLNVFNNLTKTSPVIIHGNGASKRFLNRLGNYIARAYSNVDGCIACKEDTIVLNPDDTKNWPEVTVGIFIEHPTPFLREFFQKISDLNYPKSKMTVLIHNAVKYHHEQVEKFFTDPANEYNSIKYLSPEDDSPEHEARTEAIEECRKTKCDYYLSVDSTVHFDNADTLKLLIEQNRPVLTPIMVRRDTTWSNVWGDLNDRGYYARSDDYLSIINRNLIGVWNLPFVNEVILMSGKLIQNKKISYEESYLDAAMTLATTLRDQDIFMYGTNMKYFGHLINPDGFNTSLVRPEMFEIFNNQMDWVSRYINPEYQDYLDSKKELLNPCPDVFWFPVVSDEFCDDLITMMESHGKWSGGRNNNYDERLPGGYENVPTVDIHMTQVGYNEHWLEFLKKFVQPIQQKVFIGYFHDPPNALLNFVVRYRPGEQDFLKPHHDASTYTMNIALNVPKVDFEGGGCRFVRYNCSVTDTKKGWAMIHPGRLTHYHEGLKVTKGTRYIMVSFIDP